MKLYEDILKSLKQEYDSGATYQEMAKRKGLSYYHLRSFITGKRPVNKLSLEMLFKLYPDAVVYLFGDRISGAAASKNGIAVGDNIGGRISSGADYLSAVISAVMSSDLDDAAKVKVCKIITSIIKNGT